MRNELAALKKFQDQFTRHIRNPKRFAKPTKVPTSRMRVYNALLFNSIEDVLASCFPLSKGILGTSKWKNLVRDFFTEHRCRKPFYRQVPEDFVEYLAGERKRKSDPKFLPYLAHYEWMELHLYIAPEEAATSPEKKGQVLFRKPCRLVAYPYALHQIERGSPKKMQKGKTYYFFYRDSQGEVDWMLLSPPQAKLIHLLLDRRMPLPKAFKQIAQELKQPSDFIFKAGLESLKELQDQDLIINSF